MLNIRELEKRWFQYKLKSYLPYAITTLLAIALLITTLFLPESKSAPKQELKKVTPIQKKKEKVIQKKLEVVKKEETVQVQKVQKTEPELKPEPKLKIEPKQKVEPKQLVLQPSMGFIEHFQNSEQQPYYKVISDTPKKRKKTKKKDIKKTKTIKRTKVIQTKKIEEEYLNVQAEKIPPKKNIITIERQDSSKDIQEIIKRFKKNNSPALSLFIAKKSYEIGNYEQAYNYALITNDINNGIEASWLIFAKSLVKLHKKEMAIKTLKEYIRYSHSKNAKILLNEIQTGKFQ